MRCIFLASKVVSLEDRIPKLKEKRKKRANQRLLFLLLFFFLIVICIVYFQSPLSKVGKIEINGASNVPKEQIIEISGLTDKTIIWNLDKQKIINQIMSIPEIKEAQVHFQFPNQVVISVSEFSRVGYIFEDNKFNFLLENGTIIENPSQYVLNHPGPILKNFENEEILQLLAEQLLAIDPAVKNSISEIIYSPKKTDQYSVIAYMNDGFEVHASLRTFAEKLHYYPVLIKQLDPDVKGIIDLEVGMFFKSYQSEIDSKKERGEDNEN